MVKRARENRAGEADRLGREADLHGEAQPIERSLALRADGDDVARRHADAAQIQARNRRPVDAGAGRDRQAWRVAADQKQAEPARRFRVDEKSGRLLRVRHHRFHGVDRVGAVACFPGDGAMAGRGLQPLALQGGNDRRPPCERRREQRMAGAESARRTDEG